MKTRNVVLLSAGHLTTDVNQGAVAALLPFLIAAHHLSYTEAACIVFALNGASTVVQPLFGYAADRFSKPWFLPVGLVLAGLGLALTGTVQSYTIIIVLAVVSGVGIASYHPEAARLVNLSAGNEKATAMSLFGVGGTLGFALGPLFATASLLRWGLNGTLVLAVPVSLMAMVIVIHLPILTGLHKSAKEASRAKSGEGDRNAWGPFAILTTAIMIRSVLFFGLNTFIPLYWISQLNQSEASGAVALTVMSVAGVVGNVLGGSLADRVGHTKVIVSGFSLLIPLLPALVLMTNPYVAMVLLAPIGFCLFAVYGPCIVVGQEYLPSHMGFSSGITLGVAIAVGGVTAPILGTIADHYGIRSALAGIVFLPVLAAILSLTLPDPRRLWEHSD